MASGSYPCLKSRPTRADRTVVIVYLSSRPRNDRERNEMEQKQMASLDLFQLSAKERHEGKNGISHTRNATMLFIRTRIEKRKSQRKRQLIRNEQGEHNDQAGRAYRASSTSNGMSER